MTDTRFTLRLFGPLEIYCQGVPLPKTRSRKEPWLIALLALHAAARPVERLYLASLLWPDASEDAAQYNLRRSLLALRGAMGSEAERIQSPAPRTIRINLDGADCDLTAFDSAIRRGDCTSLEEAVALYRDSLLTGCHEDWATGERDRRKSQAIQALETLAARDRQLGALGAAEARLRRILEISPLKETAVRAVMGILAAQGSHAAASNIYQSFNRRLRLELNSEPDPATADLHQEIQASARKRLEAIDSVPPASVSDVPEAALNLPALGGPLVGRTSERDAVIAQLEVSRLVTLTGPGGAGKTRLAAAVAVSLTRTYPNRVYFVDLTCIDDSSLIALTVLNSIGETEQQGRRTEEILEEVLQPEPSLIVLDNCEHLLAGAGKLSQHLLDRCPRLHILATSREPLHGLQESVWPLPPLAPAEAERLFIERARQANYAFQLTPASAAAAARICARLDGMPLAIEMAAARTRGMSPVQIASNLDTAFRLLNIPFGSASDRHRTLHAALDWSYELLKEPERTLLSKLSVFAGGWTLESAEAVCGTDTPEPEAAGSGVMEGLLSLVDKSLAVYAETTDGEGRYRFLETTRSYASERLPASERDFLCYRHARHFLQIAEDAKKSWSGPEEAARLDSLERELPNIRAALNWCLAAFFVPPVDTNPENSDWIAPATLALALSSTLMRFWTNRGHLTEGRAFLTRALEACSHHERTERLAVALNACGVIANYQRDTVFALNCHRQALEIRRSLGDKRGMAVSLHNISLIQMANADIAGAFESLSLVVSLYREIGDLARERSNQNKLISLYARDDNGGEALRLLKENLLAAERLEDWPAAAGINSTIGIVMSQQSNWGNAILYLRKSLQHHHAVGDLVKVVDLLEAIAPSLASLGGDADLPRLYGAAEALRETIHCPMLEWNREPYRLNALSSREAIGDAAFEAAWAEGRSLPVAAAVALAMGEIREAKPSPK